MNIKQLSKAYELTKRLESIDSQTSELNQLATIVVEKGSNILVAFDTVDVDQQPEPKGRFINMAFGGAVFQVPVTEMNPFHNEDEEEPDEDEFEGMFDYEITDSLALRLIAVMIQYNSAERKKIENRIKRLGVEI